MIKIEDKNYGDRDALTELIKVINYKMFVAGFISQDEIRLNEYEEDEKDYVFIRAIDYSFSSLHEYLFRNIKITYDREKEFNTSLTTDLKRIGDKIEINHEGEIKKIKISFNIFANSRTKTKNINDYVKIRPTLEYHIFKDEDSGETQYRLNNIKYNISLERSDYVKKEIFDRNSNGAKVGFINNVDVEN